jgi:hypothetical protein
MFRGSLFFGKIVWTTTFMACKCLAFAFPLTFGSFLHVPAVAFAFLEFTKFLLRVFRHITFFITLHIIVNLWQWSTTNRALVMISQCKFNMFFLSGGDHESDLSRFGSSWYGIDIARFYPKKA